MKSLRLPEIAGRTEPAIAPDRGCHLAFEQHHVQTHDPAGELGHSVSVRRDGFIVAQFLDDVVNVLVVHRAAADSDQADDALVRRGGLTTAGGRPFPAKSSAAEWPAVGIMASSPRFASSWAACEETHALARRGYDALPAIRRVSLLRRSCVT